MLKYYWLFFTLFFLIACGRDIIKTRYVPIPNDKIPPGGGNGGGGGSGSRPSYQETQALLNTYCLKCHSSAAFMGSERGLLASAAKQRVWNKSMPPNQNALPDRERQKILAFFQ